MKARLCCTKPLLKRYANRRATAASKLPNLAKLQAEYDGLTEKKNVLRVEYVKLKTLAREYVREYGVVKKNVDSILNPSAEQQQTQARRRERGAEL